MNLQIEHFDVLDSSHSWLRDHSYLAPCVILADQQNQGIGRQGHAWHSPLGNFYGSFLIQGNDLPWFAWPYVSALALFQILQAYQVRGHRIKWPNDMMIADAKLAGLMVEAKGSDFIVSMGINLSCAPEVEGRKTCAIGGDWSSYARILLAHEIYARIVLLQKAALKDFAQICKLWEQAASLQLGQDCNLFTKNQSFSGSYCGIDTQSGAVLLQDTQGFIHHIRTGDLCPAL